MTPYTEVLFLHFAGLAGLFIGYGLEWIVSSLLRRATTAEQARAWLRVYRFSLPVSGPALLLLIVTGGYLASQSVGMRAPWISASLVGILVALGIGFGMILPRVRAIRGSLPEGNAPLPAAAIANLQNPVFPTLIRVRALLALGIVYLMTLKPATLSAAFIDLGVAIIVGLIFATPVWSRTKPS